MLDHSILTSRGVKHFFIESEELLDILANMKIKKNPEILSLIQESSTIENLTREELSAWGLSAPRYHVLCGAIHHLSKDKGSIRFLFQTLGGVADVAGPENILIVDDGKTFGAFEIEKGCLDFTTGFKAGADLAATVWNLLLYTKAFPENVLAGCPEGSVDKADQLYVRRLTCSKVGLSPELAGERSIAPHLRNGFFKLLSSERFTHKRGQVIYVKSTFVKGKDVSTVKGDKDVQKK